MCNAPGLGGGSQQATGSQYGPLGGGGAATVTRNTLADLLVDKGIGGATGQYGGGVLNQLFGRAQSNVPYQLPTLDASGLQAEQANALQNPFQQAVNQALGRFSSIGASRGFLRPENVNAIAGAAAQNVAPQFAPLITGMATQNLQQRTQAPLIQEDLARQRFADLLQALGITGNLVGGSGTQASYGTQNSNWLGTALSGGVQQAAAGEFNPGGKKTP